MLYQWNMDGINENIGIQQILISLFSNCSDNCICRTVSFIEKFQCEVVFMIEFYMFDQTDASNILNITYSCRHLNLTQSRLSCLILAHHYFGHA